MEGLNVDTATVTEELVQFISSEAGRLNRDGALLGLSGGIDSALVAALATHALGPERVLTLIMPEVDSAPRSKRYALTLAKQLGTRYKVVGLSTMLALMGVYGKVPLWLLGLRQLKAKMVTILGGPCPGAGRGRNTLFERHDGNEGATRTLAERGGGLPPRQSQAADAPPLQLCGT